MTRGLQVTLSGEELKELISQRLQERTARADALDARIQEREGDQPYDVRPSDGLETLGELVEQRDAHRRRMFALRVMRDHILSDQGMTLGAADLRAADLIESDPEPPHAVDGPIEYLRRPRTDGLKLTFSGMELHELLDERIESHQSSAAWWRREAARTPEEQSEDEPMLPEEMCRNEAARHEWRVEVLSFIRSHTDTCDEYRLGATDLEFAELFPPRPSSVEQNEFEERNRAAFSLERIAKQMGRRYR